MVWRKQDTAYLGATLGAATVVAGVAISAVGFVPGASATKFASYATDGTLAPVVASAPHPANTKVLIEIHRLSVLVPTDIPATAPPRPPTPTPGRTPSPVASPMPTSAHGNAHSKTDEPKVRKKGSRGGASDQR